MIIAQGDNKGASQPAPEAERAGEPSRAPSPPPAYSPSPGTDAGPAPISVTVQQQSPELPSAFRPPSPSSFPHLHPHTNASPTGPTPFFLPAAIPITDGYYAYYDPRSTYSLALADRRAFVRFWKAFTCAVGIIVLLWSFGLIQFGTRRH
ncbi:hypothetical protein B0H19DRAFT_1070019 [Mycena capillaripes]|nr:hypothetical protein B0H19DRAFT_1070019 [Mycena capillaripes]